MKRQEIAWHSLFVGFSDIRVQIKRCLQISKFSLLLFRNTLCKLMDNLCWTKNKTRSPVLTEWNCKDHQWFIKDAMSKGIKKLRLIVLTLFFFLFLLFFFFCQYVVVHWREHGGSSNLHISLTITPNTRCVNGQPMFHEKPNLSSSLVGPSH